MVGSWKVNAKRRSFTGSRADFDAPAMSSCNAAHRGQAKSGPSRSGGEECIEDTT